VAQSLLTESATGRVRPVLMPVGSVGEIVCIALLGWTDRDGHWARATTAKALNCLPGELGHALFSFGSLVAADFMHWCGRGKPADEWKAPLGGLVLGDWLDVEGFDAEDAIRISMSLSAFHPSSEPAQSPTSHAITAPRTSDENRFLDEVRSEVERARPNLLKGFRKALSLTGKATSGELDFVGHRYITCYAAVNPKGRVSSRVQTASAALWRLARARDMFGFATPGVVELTAWIPPRGLPIFTAHDYQIAEETVSELQAQASKEDLRVFAVVDASSACRRLIDLEASAEIH